MQLISNGFVSKNGDFERENKMVSQVQDDNRTTSRLPEGAGYEGTVPSAQEVRRSAKRIARGFSADAAASAAAVVLVILGLANVAPVYMLPVATILLGAALLVKGAAVASRFQELAYETGDGREAETQLAGGMSAELLAGGAGIVLGILALIHIAPVTLTAVAVIAFGAALLLGGGETFRLSHLHWPRQQWDEGALHTARLTAESAGGGESLVGIAAVVLGILALTGINPGVLVFVGLLCLGGAELVSGFASSTFMALLQRR
jgi:hypothetical protein